MDQKTMELIVDIRRLYKENPQAFEQVAANIKMQAGFDINQAG